MKVTYHDLWHYQATVYEAAAEALMILAVRLINGEFIPTGANGEIRDEINKIVYQDTP
jgi:hypothetical protein